MFIFFTMVGITAFAYDFEEEGIYYDYIEGEEGNSVGVTNGSNLYSGEIFIPESVKHNGKYYNVTRICNYAFFQCEGLTSVTIPNSVITIGANAFDGCYGLTTLTLGNSLTSIGSFSFSSCNQLTSVIIPNSVITIKNHAFFGCDNLSSVILGNNVETIEERAFSGCPIGGITIPNSVKSIGNKVFSGCGDLTSIIVEENNPIYDSRNNCNAIIKTETNSLVVGCKTTIIPEDVVSIGAYAFYESNINSITIPNSVITIGTYAFYESGINSIIIPNSVTRIGEYAFSDSRINSVTFGNGLTTIPYCAFSYCRQLTSVIIPKNVNIIEEHAFTGCVNMTTLSIGDNVKIIEYGAFEGCYSITSLHIPDGVEQIGNNAFWGCSSLATVIIGKNVTTIGGEAFSSCRGLTSVTIGRNTGTIGHGAFKNCTNLIDVYCHATEVPICEDGLVFNYEDSYSYYDNFEGTPINEGTLHVPLGCKNNYEVTEPWSNFGTIVEEIFEDEPVPKDIILTAEENDGLVDLRFNSISNDLRYRVGRLDQNGKRKKVYETSVSQYPNMIHVVDNPMEGRYTYYVQAVYEDADGTSHPVSSNEVTIDVADTSNETTRTGVITGRVVFDDNVTAIIPSVVNLNIKFSDGETVRMQHNGLFYRDGIELGSTLTISIPDDDYYTYESVTVNVTEQTRTQLQIINATRREDAPAQISNGNFDLTITSMITGIPNEFNFEVTNTSENSWTGNIDLIAVRKKEANDVSNLTQSQVSFASVKTYYRAGSTYISKILPGKKTTVNLPVTDFPVLLEDEYYTFYIVSRKIGDDNNGNFKLLAIGYDGVTNPKEVLMEATSGGHDYSEFIENEVNACVAEVISLMGQLDKYGGPMSKALSQISYDLKEYERTKDAEGLLGNLPDLLKTFSDDLKNAIKDVKDFTDILKDVKGFYDKLEAINEFRNADDFKKFIILSQKVIEYSGIPFAGVYSYYFDIAENAVKKIREYMQDIINAELSQSFEDNSIEIRIKVRKNNWFSGLWTSYFSPSSVAGQIQKVDVHMCSKNSALTSATDGNWQHASYVAEASDDYVVLRRVGDGNGKNTMEKTQRFWAEITWYNGRITKVPLLYDDMVDYEGSSRVKPKITITLQSGSSSSWHMADKIQLVTNYDE